MAKLTAEQRAVITVTNKLYEDCGYDRVTTTDVYTNADLVGADLTFEQIEQAIATHPLLDVDPYGEITSCPDSQMVLQEYGA